MPETRTEIRNIDTLYALATGRQTYFQKSLDDYTRQKGISGQYAHEGACPRKARDPNGANLISSEVRPGVHLPVIDCDYGIQAIASSTPGHYHLYIDKELSWQQYMALLNGLFAAGLIEKGWYDNAVREGRTYVRLPHIKKPTDVDDSMDTPDYIGSF